MASDLLPTENAQAGPIPVEQPRRRLESIDLLRGLLMLLMAIDHSRDYFFIRPGDPTDPHISYPALFLTRWITHLCAPGFIALAGASVYIQRARGKTPAAMRSFLLTRGLWLLTLEVTVISFGWMFSTAGTLLQVIWAIAIAMLVLGLMQGLRTATIGGIGIAILLFHNLLDPITGGSFGRGVVLWDLLHQPDFFRFHGHAILMIYPVLPWTGVILTGYWFGALANSAMPAPRRRAWTFSLSGLLFAAFALLRLIGRYGDGNHVEKLGSFNRDAMSFFRVDKYPPSLEYVLITFSALLLLYSLFDLMAQHNVMPRLRGVIGVYGRVPFFYYMLHLYLLHGMAMALAVARHGNWRGYEGIGPLLGHAAVYSYGLTGVYGFWLLAVGLLYAPCLWFSRLKARRRDWWLSYL